MASTQSSLVSAQPPSGMIPFASSARREQNKALPHHWRISKQSCDQMAIGVGPRSHADCPHRVTSECYSPEDDASRSRDQCVISTGFWQRPRDGFRALLGIGSSTRDGRLSVRDFVRPGQVSFYKDRFFRSVAHRGCRAEFQAPAGSCA